MIMAPRIKKVRSTGTGNILNDTVVKNINITVANRKTKRPVNATVSVRVPKKYKPLSVSVSWPCGLKKYPIDELSPAIDGATTGGWPVVGLM